MTGTEGGFPSFLARHEGLFQPRDVDRLAQSVVAIAGVGGVGGRVAEVLARSGVGTLRLADPDTFDMSNLNRQAGSTLTDLGSNKAAVVARLCESVSPNITVTTYETGITAETIDPFIEHSDVIIDGTDYTIPSLGLMLARRAVQEALPVVIGAEVAFGAWHTVLRNHGDFERLLGLSAATTLEDLDSGRVSIPLWRWVLEVPPYVDTNQLKKVSDGELVAPAIAPAVELSAALMVTDVLRLLTGQPPLAEAPRIHMADAVTGKSTVFRPSRARFTATAARAQFQTRRTHRQTNATELGSSTSPVRPKHAAGAFKQPADRDVDLLLEALRAPSPHNVQLWRLVPAGDRRYELHYDESLNPPADPTNKDSYLTMGAFIETISLLAPAHGLAIEVEEVLRWHENDLHAATFGITEATGKQAADPLEPWIRTRTTNRHPYEPTPLPSSLRASLHELGNTVVETEVLASVTRDACVDSWQDKQFIDDLQYWFRSSSSAPDGITPAAFLLSPSDVAALKLAFLAGRVRPRWLAAVYAARDVSVFLSGHSAAIVGVQERTPTALLDAGRRLLRSWLTVQSHGLDYQPYSVAVDSWSAVARVSDITGVPHPVALYRVGKAIDKPGSSNRHPLQHVLRPSNRQR